MPKGEMAHLLRRKPSTPESKGVLVVSICQKGDRSVAQYRKSMPWLTQGCTSRLGNDFRTNTRKDEVGHV